MKTAPLSTHEMIPEILRVLHLEAQSILQCAERIQNNSAQGNALQKALEYFQSSLNNHGKIVVTGVGKSGKIAQKIAATLCSTGSLAVFLHPTEGLHGDLGLITPQDTVLALSHTGNTDELVRLLPSFKHLHVPIVGVGGNPSSRLASECTVWIDASVPQEACPLNLAPTTSTTLSLAIGDALALALMRLQGFNAESFAKNHPGGTLGNRLTLRVSDVMHRGNDVGTVQEQSPMEEVIIRSTEKKMGAVLVVEGSYLKGLITDGDLRRALRHQERFFQLKAQDVMTQNPITVRPETMAWEALDLMENRPSQISVLPVINTQGHWEGLVRVHDLAKNL